MTNKSPEAELLPTQVDRDAAADVCDLLGWANVAKLLRNDQRFPYDEAEGQLIQLLARHRLAGIEAGQRISQRGGELAPEVEAIVEKVTSGFREDLKQIMARKTLSELPNINHARLVTGQREEEYIVTESERVEIDAALAHPPTTEEPVAWLRPDWKENYSDLSPVSVYPQKGWTPLVRQNPPATTERSPGWTEKGQTWLDAGCPPISPTKEPSGPREVERLRELLTKLRKNDGYSMSYYSNRFNRCAEINLYGPAAIAANELYSNSEKYVEALSPKRPAEAVDIKLCNCWVCGGTMPHKGWPAEAIPRLPHDQLLYGTPDYIDDPKGLRRIREEAIKGSGHDMVGPCLNKNSLCRLLDTIERLRAAYSAASRHLSGGRGRQIAAHLARWRDNLKITRGSPVAGDALHGPALDFVIEQLDTILSATTKEPSGPREVRCSRCDITPVEAAHRDWQYCSSGPRVSDIAPHDFSPERPAEAVGEPCDTCGRPADDPECECGYDASDCGE